MGLSQGLFLWVPPKDSSYGSLSLSRTSHGRGKLPHLFDNFMSCFVFFRGGGSLCEPFAALLWGRRWNLATFFLVKCASLKLIVKCNNFPTKKILEICPFLLDFVS
jgi:hypothetical protein